MAKLLVVEDDEKSARLIETFLLAAQHSVRLVDNAEAALQCLQHEDFDVVLSDIKLPGMSGLEMAQALRGHPARSQFRLLAVTASAMTGTDTELLVAGFDDWLAKPYRRSELLEKLQTLLRR